MILEAIPSSEKETNPWVSAEARFDEAAELLGLDEGLRKILRMPALELKVSVPVLLDDGRYEVFTGYRVHHSIVRGPAKGGIRFAPDVTLDEVRAVHPAFDRDWVEVFDLGQAMARRAGTGMPGPAQLKKQFARWQKILQ